MKNEAIVKSEVIKSENAAAQQEAEIEIDPATDLNIFEQFNFDEMNINIEDINQNNQK